MSPTITLSDETFHKLQTLAKAFVDTPESVISDLADAELRRRSGSGTGSGRGPKEEEPILSLDPDAHDNLTHTRLLSATVDGHPIHRPKWNGILDYLHVLARQRFDTFELVRRATGANVRDGRYEESGFRYVPEADLSIQGVDANLAWDHSLRLARALAVPLRLRLEWRNKEAAAHPGQTAFLEWTPEAT
jgi:hypothetical protein